MSTSKTVGCGRDTVLDLLGSACRSERLAASNYGKNINIIHDRMHLKPTVYCIGFQTEENGVC